MIHMYLRDSSDNIIANKMRLYSTISQIKDTLNYFSHFYEIFETDTNYVLSDSLKNRVDGIIKHVKFLLTSENGNLYLKENKIVKAFWEGLEEWPKGHSKAGQKKDITDGLRSPKLIGYVDAKTKEVVKF